MLVSKAVGVGREEEMTVVARGRLESNAGGVSNYGHSWRTNDV